MALSDVYVGQYVFTDSCGARIFGRVEAIDAEMVGVRWDSGRLGWLVAADLAPDER